MVSACEWADVGHLAVTWRFNGHADEQGTNPCAGLGADRIVIEVDGPEQFSDVVTCDNVDPDYPLIWLGFVADLPTTAYGRLLRDVERGTYDVRVFFIDADGNPLSEPDTWTGTVTVNRDEISRIDLDFGVTTGSLTARWRIGGSSSNAATCEMADASQIHLVVSDSGGQVSETTVDCVSSSGAVLAGLAPGTYDVTGQLLDGQGSPITEMVTSTGHDVSAADTTGLTLAFPWSSFLVPPTGNARFLVTYDDESTVCSAVTGLAQGPLQTRMGLALGGQSVSGAQAYANPAGQQDCAGLTAAQSLDGTTLAPCTDDELIVCDLPAGDYQLTVSALDASDLVCYGATVDLEVTPEPPEEAVAAVVTSSDATHCWE